jgi:hypothetical protein
MIIKLTLSGLVILLIAVIAISYYVNYEGFEDITKGAMNKSNMKMSTTNISNKLLPDSIPVSSDKGIMPVQIPNSVIPEKIDIVPEVSISKSGYDSMALQQKMDLLKDIQKVVRNELIASRSTEPVGVLGSRGKVTDSTAQGKEYEDSCYKDTEYRCPKNPDGTCPPIPDMTKYIKKDEIPCWGCSIDY